LTIPKTKENGLSLLQLSDFVCSILHTTASAVLTAFCIAIWFFLMGVEVLRAVEPGSADLDAPFADSHPSVKPSGYMLLLAVSDTGNE
jgi:hypothetical protein